MDSLVEDGDEYPRAGIQLDLACVNVTERGTKLEDRMVVVGDKENAQTFSKLVQQQRAIASGMVWRRMIELL